MLLFAGLCLQPHALAYISDGLQFTLKSLIAVDEL